MARQPTIRPELPRAAWVYLAASGVGHSVWEVLQLPLYTLWSTATLREQAFDVTHCTVGDVLIAMSCLIVALIVNRARFWPTGSRVRVALTVIALGLGYTVFSEWLNVSVRGAWAYAPSMPVLPLGSFSIGLSPLAQWLIVPPVALWAASRASSMAERR